MKVIEAYWEKRNLGIETVEIECEEPDTLQQLKEGLAQLKTQYAVVKIPVERSDLSEYVQQMGYVYVEDLMEMIHDLHEANRSKLHQRLYDATTYRRMNEQDIKQLDDEIAGGMFDSDRISKDAQFGAEQSAKRYRNWVADLLDKGALPYVILYKEEPAGFIILQTKDDKNYDSVLGGGYAKFRNSGLGIIQKEQEIVKKLGGRKVTTHVSTNNPSQVKALCMNGYLPGKIRHVFVKHF